MKLHAVKEHYRYNLLELSRSPLSLVLNLALPVMVFLVFGAGKTKLPEAANYLTLSFMTYSVLSVVFYQFGAMVAEARGTPWVTTLRALPHGWSSYVLARIGSGLTIALLASLGIYAAAAWSTPITLSVSQTLQALLRIVVGSLPFALLGVWITLFFSRSIAVPLSQFLYFPLCYFGGLWIPYENLPPLAQILSPWFPTRHYGELVWATLDSSWPYQSLGILCGFTALVAALIWRQLHARNENRAD
jgi:ABC-2 type transport system permease protein